MANGNEGASKLANIMRKRMKEESVHPLYLDYGEINGDYSLTTNTFPKRIPQKDYTVCRHVTRVLEELVELQADITGDGAHGGHTGGTGSHEHGLNAKLDVDKLRLKPGDRVLVAWVQNEVTVIDVIVPATKI